MVQQRGNGSGVTEFVSGTLVAKYAVAAVKIDAGFDLITEDDASGEAVSRILEFCQPMMYQIDATDGTEILANAQTQANYDGVGDNGSFVGGDGHADADVITLSNNATLTVTANVGGVVSEFIIDSTGANAIPVEGVALTQANTTGTGGNVTLTPGGNNITGGGGVIHLIMDAGQFDAASLQVQLRAIGVDTVNSKDFSSLTVTEGTSLVIS